MVGRHWLFRVSIGANAFVLFYFALYSTTSTYPTTTTPLDVSPASSPLINNKNYNSEVSSQSFDEIGDGSRVLSQFSQQPRPGGLETLQQAEGLLPQGQGQSDTNNSENQAKEIMDPADQPVDEIGQPPGIPDENSVPSSSKAVGDVNNAKGIKEGLSRENAHSEPEPQDEIINSENNGEDENLDSKKLVESSSNPNRVKLFPCDDLTPRTYFGQRGPFWVLYNYVKPTRLFACDESLTYTTHADFTFLDNLIPLLERWQGPISLSLYCPGTDFSETMKRINYLRECAPNSFLVKEFVNFHLFFDYKHTPKVKIPSDPTTLPVNCSAFTPNDIRFGENLPTYKKTKKLPYPVNVARNVARETATTHYILPSDIELYPNPNLIPDFIDMLRRNTTELQRPNPNKLFVLSIFEVEANVTALPQDKSELIYMLTNKTAIPFHKYVCSNCHRIPKAKEWISAKIKSGLNVFHVGKRYKPYHHWEPIYIGTKYDPLYDERLTWEGRSDKMTQVRNSAKIKKKRMMKL